MMRLAKQIHNTFFFDNAPGEIAHIKQLNTTEKTLTRSGQFGIYQLSLFLPICDVGVGFFFDTSNFQGTPLVLWPKLDGKDRQLFSA